MADKEPVIPKDVLEQMIDYCNGNPQIPVAEVIRKFGMEEHKVQARKRLSEAGITRYKYCNVSKDKLQEMYEMYMNGIKVHDVLNGTGMNWSSALKAFGLIGLDITRFRSKGWTQEELRDVSYMYFVQRYTIRDIANKHQRSYGNIREMLVNHRNVLKKIAEEVRKEEC